MAEYIERKKLIDNICNDTASFTVSIVIRHIKNIPAADVVEVVRCKDCEHFNEIGTDYCIKHHKGYCEYDNTIKSKYHYCGYGKRKSDTE